MEVKRQQLVFDKGITNVPSDLICSDNTLEESVGMVYDNGEHRVIQAPVEQMHTNTAYHATILYIHNYNDSKRYIVIRKQGQTDPVLAWCTVGGNKSLVEGDTFSDVDVSDPDKVHVTSIGKILVVTCPSGTFRYFWQVDDNNYSDNIIVPEPEFNFFLKDGDSVENSGDATDIIYENDGGWRNPVVPKLEPYNNLVVGAYSKNLRSIEQKKGFCRPFFIRTALKLYDDSYMYISQPIMMMPSVLENSRAIYDRAQNNLRIITDYRNLYFTQKKSLSHLSDIVKDIDIFISQGIEMHDLSVDQPFEGLTTEPTGVAVKVDGIYRETSTSLSKYHNKTYPAPPETPTITGNFKQYQYPALKKKDPDDLEKDITGTSVFYKLCSIGLESITEAKDVSKYIEVHTLENLTTQESLPEDDWFSRNDMVAEFAYSYNSRLNIANVKRGFFEGFDFFLPYDDDSASEYTFYTSIKTEGGTKIVRHKSESTNQMQGIYYFYPDSRATHVVIYRDFDGMRVCDQDLIEHPSLNGAYYLRGLPGAVVSSETVESHDGPTGNDNDAKEQLPNYIIQSEVNNPWVFKAEGYFKVGTGKIKGMSSITQALSDGQFGQYPLLVFSENGIWALSVASTGYYSSIHPMSREVCNNTKSITQTDGAVFFSSEKGLMVVAGNQVKCVSEQLSGKESTFIGEVNIGNFKDYLKGCCIAYDYRDSLLWISNKNYAYSWIYAIKHGTFGKYYGTFIQAVNDYPDYLLSEMHEYYSLMDRPDINDDDDKNTYSGLMITRPMKLENGLALKSLMQIMHVKQLSSGASMTMQIYASNNVNNWVELHSLRGTPWKYYRFRYNFTNLKAVDRFGGTLVLTQERRNNKMR